MGLAGLGPKRACVPQAFRPLYPSSSHLLANSLFASIRAIFSNQDHRIESMRSSLSELNVA